MPDLTVQEVADLAKVSAQCVRNWCDRGLIPGAWNASTAGVRKAWRIPVEGWQQFRSGQQRGGEQAVTAAPARPSPHGGRPARVGPRVAVPQVPSYFA